MNVKKLQREFGIRYESYPRDLRDKISRGKNVPYSRKGKLFLNLLGVNIEHDMHDYLKLRKECYGIKNVKSAKKAAGILNMVLLNWVNEMKITYSNFHSKVLNFRTFIYAVRVHNNWYFNEWIKCISKCSIYLTDL